MNPTHGTPRSGRAVNVHMRVPIVFSLQPAEP